MQSAKFYKGEFITIRLAQTKKPIITVSKKISNKAVVRNKLRRQIKALLQQNKLASVIVKVTRRPQDNQFSSLKKDIEQCLSR